MSSTSSATAASTGSIFSPTEAHTDLRDMLRKWVSDEVEPQAHEHNRDERFNHKLFKELGNLGLLGIAVEEEFGGSGLDATAAVIAHEELAYSDPAFCLSYLAHSMLFVNNLNQNGNVAQKQKYLPKACSGELIGGMCMSEPSAGSDVFAMKSVASKSGSGYSLTGNKMWITNGCINDTDSGDVFLVYARTGEGSNPREDFTQFVVESTFKGFSLGSKITDKCGMRASGTAELVFDQCEVPEENVVGTVGKAHLCMMRNLEVERLTLAAMSLGIARRSIDVMNQYASDRPIFGKPLRSYGQIQAFIADSYAEYMAARAYTYEVANRTNLSEAGMRLDSDGAKLFAGTMGKRVADRAIQTLGGNGYIGDYNVERLWRDSKLLEIGGGTNEILQVNMSRDLRKIDKLE